MANNRAWLCCRICIDEDPANAYLFILKYYPSQGWYIPRDADEMPKWPDHVQRWLDNHKHMTGDGEYLKLVDEEGKFQLSGPLGIPLSKAE